MIKKPAKLLLINTDELLLKKYSREGFETEVLSSVNFLDALQGSFVPDLVIISSVEKADIPFIRKNPALSNVPVLVIQESFKELNNLNSIADFPKVFICNRVVCETGEFIDGLKKLCAGERKLLCVKASRNVMYAILYMNKNLSRQLTRSMFASQLGINADYLTKIFRLQTGVSLWDYLNEYRLFEARKLLEETGLTAAEIARRTGFADDAYFSNVYSKKFGEAPCAVRKR